MNTHGWRADSIRGRSCMLLPAVSVLGLLELLLKRGAWLRKRLPSHSSEVGVCDVEVELVSLG
ncbi:MAG: hypothetical protein LBT97_13290 [Planctomycetota bacterium]|nr:hypothetical protein [Planctomycetota bacterium]